MDPLSITISAVALIQLCAQTVRYVEEVKDVSRECARLKAEIRTTEAILVTLSETVTDSDHSEKQWVITVSAIGGPQGPLKELQALLLMLRDKLASRVPSNGVRGLGKRLLWPFQTGELKDIMTRLDRQRNLLMLALENDHGTLLHEIQRDTRTLVTGMDEVKTGVQNIENAQQRQDCQEIIDWIPASDFSSQQSDFINRRQEGTGKWLLESREFKQWIEQEDHLLCTGMPGAGKTIISSIVVDELHRTFQQVPGIGIAYIYLSAQRQRQQAPVDLALSLLKQWLQGIGSTPPIVRTIQARCKQQGTRPSWDDALKMLYSVVGDFSRTFVVIDALDEAEESHTMNIIKMLQSLHAKAGTKIFATSRHIPRIELAFAGSPNLEIKATDEDVERYIDGNMPRLPAFVARNPKLQEEIKNTIIRAVKGMFLLAQLHLSSLVGKRSPKALRAMLNKIPTGSEGYDWAYCEIMERVKKQTPDSCAMALQTLAWVSGARRPLSTSELCHALAVEEGETGIDEDNIPDIEDILTVCVGLVAADKMGNTVRLVHFTTKEYFNRTWQQWFPEGPAEIAATCATYLSFDTFDGPCASDEEFEKRLQDNSLFGYACRNWGYHAGDLPSGVNETGLSLLHNQEHMNAITQLLFAVPGSPGYSQRVPTGMTGLHIAAYFGLSNGTSALLKLGFLPNIVNSYGQSPLWFAAKNGHVDVVRALLAAADTGVDRADDVHQQTPLWWAVSNGHDEIVRLLLEMGADPNTKDQNYGRSPLLWTSRFGRTDVVKLLLEKSDIDVNAKDSLYQDTPLTWASKNNHLEIVALLLAHPGVDLEMVDMEMEQTALSWAARRGNMEILRLLLQTGKVQINTLDKHGASGLAWACRHGHLRVVETLLAQPGIEFDARDNYGITPLDCARGAGHVDVVRAMVQHFNGGIPVSVPDSNELSFITLVRRGDLDKATAMLADCQVDVNFRDDDGWSALLWAARDGLVEMARLLLSQSGIDVNIHDTWGQTPLWWAARGGHAAVAKLLLEKTDINVNTRIANPVDEGETALAQATRSGHAAVARLILDRSDVDPSIKDCYYRTPVLWAAREGHDAVLKMLLLRADIDVNAQDMYGRSALAWAGRHGHETAVHLLLADKRVVSDLRDSYGRQPLSWAEEHGHQDVASMLRRRSSAQ